MNKRVLIRSIGLSLLLIFSVLTVSGCGIFNSDDTLEDIDVPNEEEQENEEGLVEDDQAEGEEKETVARQLFLISEEGIVVPQTIEIPKADSNEVATQVLEYLVKDGPVSQLLPNGFEAVLPVGTEILGLNLQEDGTMIVDLSNEFKEYEASKEQQIIQAMTYTLTQFDNVDKVKLWINGFELTEMPVNGTPIMNGYSRANGINLIESEAIDLLNSEAVTVYYPTQLGPNFHYVPVTQHIEIDSDNRYQSIVQALLDGPSYQSNFLHVFNPNVEILDIEELEDGILSIEFTEEILADVNEAYIADEVIETLVLTLTDQPDVSALSISVADIEQVFNEHGVPYIEPVTRDTFVPTGSL